jgi:hypothetical protein
MRRFALVAVLLLTGCSGSGFLRYEEDTFTFPWQNPNQPVRSGENFVASRQGTKSVQSPQLLTESGDIWPGQTQPVPTLKDLQKQQSAEATGSPGLTPLPPLPSLPGYEISAPEPGSPAPGNLFSGAVGLPGGRNTTTRYGIAGGAPGMPSAQAPTTAQGGNIVVPNGNGTNTVISPTGKVTVVPADK